MNAKLKTACPILTVIVSLVFPILANSQAVTSTVQLDLAWVDEPFFNPCALGGQGEWMIVNNRVHGVIHVTTIGNKIHTKAHYQPQVQEAVGQTTGDTYHGGGVTQWEENYIADSFPYTLTWISYGLFVGPGRGNNLYLVDKYHITVDANGEVSVEHSMLDTICR
jgi:hypothetical protein